MTMRNLAVVPKPEPLPAAPRGDERVWRAVPSEPDSSVAAALRGLEQRTELRFEELALALDEQRTALLCGRDRFARAPVWIAVAIAAVAIVPDPSLCIALVVAVACVACAFSLRSRPAPPDSNHFRGDSDNATRS